MLKRIRFFLIGALLFLLIDIGVLVYYNNYYLKDTGSFSAKKITSSTVQTIPKKISIDSNATDLQVSHDGNYLAYLKDGTIIVVELSSGQKYAIQHDNQMHVSTFKWIYDRDRLMIAETSTMRHQFYGKLYYCDMTDKNPVEIRDNYYNKDIKVLLSSSSDKITDLDMSAETNLIFLKITRGDGTNRLWEINIMVSNNSLSNTVAKNIGGFVCLKRSNSIFYEDTNNGEVYLYGNRKPISILDNSKLKILGVDQNDNVYFASMKNGLVEEIYYGSVKDNSWKRLSVNRIVDTSRFFVTYQGDVFEDNQTESAIVNQETKASHRYTGQLIGVFDSGFLSEVNDLVQIKI